MRYWIACTVLLLAGYAHAADPLPIFDTHVHYSEETWARMPPKDAIALLRKAGVKRALVSSSNDDGNQKLYAEAPDLIVPSLRTYRTRNDINTWFKDEGVARYLRERLKKYRYAAIGEFHVFDADADAPVARVAVQLAKEYKLVLHAHSDAAAVERIYAGHEPPGAVLGLLGQTTYQTTEKQLSSGDTILLYTDGLREATNAAGEEFGLDRLIDAVRQRLNSSPEDLLKELISEATRFSAATSFEDDICLVTVEWA